MEVPLIVFASYILIVVICLKLRRPAKVAKPEPTVNKKPVTADPFGYLRVNKIELMYGNTITMLMGSPPKVITFNDVLKGDYQETVHLLIGPTGFDIYRTASHLVERYRRHHHLGYASVTLDRTGRVDVITHKLEGMTAIDKIFLQCDLVLPVE